MEKSIIGKNVYYNIFWSPICHFDKHRARGIPEMAGILCLLQEMQDENPRYLIFYHCWKDGLRTGLKNITDPADNRFPDIIQYAESKKLLYKFTVIENSFLDLCDIMYWLIKEYEPEFNIFSFNDSKRYKDIFLKETSRI